MARPDVLQRHETSAKETGPDYKGRINRLRELFQPMGASAALITSPRNVSYFTGFKGLADLDERETELLVTPSKTHLLLKPFYDAEAKERTQNAETVPTRRPFNYTKDFSDITDIMQQEGLPLVLAAEKPNLTWDELDALKNAGFKEEDLKGLIIERDIRAVKDAWEIQQLREACSIGDKGFDFITNQLKPGMTEAYVKEQLETYLLSQPNVDGLSFPALVTYGANAADPHRESSSTIITPGNFLSFDFGVTVNGYHSDMTRVVFIGTPTAEQIQMYQTALIAQQRALDYAATANPVEGAKIDATANAYIQSQGYPEFVAYSHGIGSADHERPDLLPTSADIIKPDMIFTAEPGIYVHGVAGIRIEDEIRKTEDGIEILTHSPKDLLCIDIESNQRKIIPAAQLLTKNFPFAA